MKLTEAELDMLGWDREPDGWVIVHHRYDDNLLFGPFGSMEECTMFLDAHPLVDGQIRPTWRTVNWNRRG